LSRCYFGCYGLFHGHHVVVGDLFFCYCSFSPLVVKVFVDPVVFVFVDIVVDVDVDHYCCLYFS
jgi:hypothetical protein